MVIFAGYENFVSRFDLVQHKYKTGLDGACHFGDLKPQLMTSIVAIAAIDALEGFMNIGQMSDREMAWSVRHLNSLRRLGCAVGTNELPRHQQRQMMPHHSLADPRRR